MTTASVMPTFPQALAAAGCPELRSDVLQVLQINLGKLCNQACRHCHVDAGPQRTEIMPRPIMQACLDAVAGSPIQTIDITGGAPEINPHFRWLVAQLRRLQRQVIDRCNLTVLLTAGQEDLPAFLAENRVAIVASLPCYLAENTDAQRGQGVFARSIAGLQRLNAVGYGRPGSGLTLTLVHNPLGPALPPSQRELEQAYRHHLQTQHGVVFNHLITITNMPINRFRRELAVQGQYASYMDNLQAAFNPATVSHLMCRSTLSVSWDGRLFDCDFNQMQDLGLEPGLPQHIQYFDWTKLAARRIVTGPHCFGCTAGCGSSCQGTLT